MVCLVPTLADEPTIVKAVAAIRPQASMSMVPFAPVPIDAVPGRLAALTGSVLEVVGVMDVLAVLSEVQDNVSTGLPVNFSAAIGVIEFPGQIFVPTNGDVGILAVEISRSRGCFIFVVFDHVRVLPE